MVDSISGAGFTTAAVSVRSARVGGELDQSQQAATSVAEQEAGSAADIALRPLSFGAEASLSVKPTDFDLSVLALDNTVIASVNAKVDARIANATQGDITQVASGSASGADSFGDASAAIANASSQAGATTAAAGSASASAPQGASANAPVPGGIVDVEV